MLRGFPAAVGRPDVGPGVRGQASPGPRVPTGGRVGMRARLPGEGRMPGLRRCRRPGMGLVRRPLVHRPAPDRPSSGSRRRALPRPHGALGPALGPVRRWLQAHPEVFDTARGKASMERGQRRWRAAGRAQPKNEPHDRQTIMQTDNQAIRQSSNQTTDHAGDPANGPESKEEASCE